jgi:hypothetical protein
MRLLAGEFQARRAPQSVEPVFAEHFENCCPPGECLGPDEQIATGHFHRLRQPEKKEQGWRYVAQDAVLDSKLRGISGYVDEVDKVGGVGGVGRAIRVAHELAVAVVGGHEALPA